MSLFVLCHADPTGKYDTNKWLTKETISRPPFIVQLFLSYEWPTQIVLVQAVYSVLAVCADACTFPIVTVSHIVRLVCEAEVTDAIKKLSMHVVAWWVNLPLSYFLPQALAICAGKN